MSMSPERAVSSATGFRSTVNTVRNEKKWVSPFRQSNNAVAASTATKSSPVVQKSTVEFPKPKEGDHTEDTQTATATKKEPKTNGIPASSKKVIVEPIIDLGGGLKMPESKILAIAKEKLSKDLQTIDDKATEQKRLKELKHQKKLELEALKDQSKINSRFAKFKRKLDFEKNKFSNDHQQKVTELESAIAAYNKQIADFDKKTHDEIDAHQKDHEDKSAAADEKLAKDKETTILDADTKEKEHLDTIHNHVISQKRAEISSRVLHAQRSEYELKLELLQLQLAQNEREVLKEQGVVGEHSAVKEDLENKVKDLQNAIAENDAAIAESKESESAAEADLKASEEELENSKATVEELKQKLIEVKAGAPDRATRLVDAKKKRLEYEEEQERLRLEEEKRKKKQEEERKKREEEERIAREKKEEEERIAKAKAADEARIAAEKKVEEDRIANEQAEEAAKKFEQNKIANTAVESPEPVEKQSSTVPAAVIASSAAAGAPITGTAAATTSAGAVETSSTLVPTASKEETKKRRVSGFFSVFKRKDKDANVEEVSKATESKSKPKTPLAAAAVVGGATAIAATGAAIAGATADKAAEGTSKVVTSASDSRSVSKPAEVAPTTNAQTTTEALTPVLTPESEEAPTSGSVKSPAPQAGEVVQKKNITLESSEHAPALDNVNGVELKPEIVAESHIPVVGVASQDFEVSLEQITAQEAKKGGDSEVTTGVLTSLPTPPNTAPQETKEAFSKESDSPNVQPQISASSGSTKELSSREPTPEPAGGTGKNAKKNAKKKAAKKRKKAAAAAAAAAILPVSSTAVVAADAVVGASGEDQSEGVESKSFGTQDEAKAITTSTTQEESEVGYVEPKPVEIPDDQKFSPVEGVSPVSHVEELAKGPTETQNQAFVSDSANNGLLKTVGVSAAVGTGVTAPDVASSEKNGDSFPTLDPNVAGRVEPASQPQVKNEADTHIPEKGGIVKASSSHPTSEKKGFFKRFLSHPSKSSPPTSPNATPAINSEAKTAAGTGTNTATAAAATALSTSKSTATDYENDSLYSYREVIVEEEVEI